MQAAVDMMRKVLNTVNMDGVIVIGEGEKDEVQKLQMSCAIALMSCYQTAGATLTNHLRRLPFLIGTHVVLWRANWQWHPGASS